MKIAAIAAELHVIEGHVNYLGPIRLAVNFDDESSIRLCGIGDGEGVTLDRLPLEEPMDLGEFGRTAIFDVTDRLGEPLRNAKICELRSIRNPAKKLIGLALLLEKDEPFCIWMDGDEFHWGAASVLADWDWAPDGTGKIGDAVKV